MESSEFTVQVASEEHIKYIPEILKTIEDATKVRGTGIAKRNPDYVEKKIRGREINMGVLGERHLPGVEIIPTGEYFDYRCKYQSGASTEICPAPITEDEREQIGEMAEKLHKTLGMAVYSRSDFILDAEGKAWCLEINTLPGMTPTSLVPQEAAAIGISYADLCDRIVRDSLIARKAERA